MGCQNLFWGENKKNISKYRYCLLKILLRYIIISCKHVVISLKILIRCHNTLSWRNKKKNKNNIFGKKEKHFIREPIYNP